MPALEERKSKIRRFARDLRRSGTDAEQRLWMHLRDRRLKGAKFRRQHPIGPFIVDFCCPECGMVIELDGGQHAIDASSDQRRTDLLNRLGFRVLRFWDHDVLANTDAVLERIAETLTNPHPAPLPRRERESAKGSSLPGRERESAEEGPLRERERGSARGSNR